MAQQTMPDTRRLQKDELKALAMASGPCLSLFTSWRNSGNVREIQTRWKELIRQAEQKIDGRGLDQETRKSLLSPLADALDGADMTSGPGQGIAVFRSPEVFRVVKLPHAVDESVVLADHFSIRSLLPVLGAERHFYILALSQNRMRLLRCTDHSSEEVPWPSHNVSDNLSEFMQTEQPDHDLENRSSAGPSLGAMRGVHFGTGSEKERKDENLRHFFKAVDRGLCDIFRHETAPLILAGVEYELSIYRDVCTYARLAADDVHGAPDGLKGGEMHKRALDIVEKECCRERDQQLAKYDSFFGAGKASVDLKEIVRAAFDGRIAFLFVTEGGEVPGNFDEATRRVRKHGQPHLGDEDLLNAAAIQTLLHSGEVQITPHNRMPNHSRMAALMRY